MSQRYWSGKTISHLKSHQVFVFGSNPEGRHGMGAAKAAMQFGAKYGKGRGLSGQTYALVTKNLTEGFYEFDVGIEYPKAGFASVSREMIKVNIAELYSCALANPDKDFLVVYQENSKNLNGYSATDMLELFTSMNVPNNVLLHDSFKPKEFRIVVAGGRDFTDLAKVTAHLDRLLINKKLHHEIVIVCGMARGADMQGYHYANNRGYKIAEYHADWDGLGKSAGYRRNEDMAKACDAVVAFWDGKSKGTGHMIDLAKKYNKQIRIINY